MQVAEEPSPDGRCAQCESRRSKRQAVIDWTPVIFRVIWEVMQSFWF
jgi:hypothetical protein